MKITNLPALQALQNETLVYAVIIAVVALCLSLLLASLIAWQGGEDRSYIKRRIAFCSVGLVACISFFLYNDLVVKPNISNMGWQNMFSKTNIVSVSVILGVYVVLGVIFMFVFKHKKFGSILPRKFKN